MAEQSLPDGAAPRRGGRPSRRLDIVQAATEAFAATGYHNTSLNDIAEQLGMTAAGVLHHFKSKENLLVEVLDFRDNLGPNPTDATGRAFFDSLVAVAARNEIKPGLTQLYTVLSAESLTHDHPAQDWFRERYDRVRHVVRQALIDEIGEGWVSIADEVDAGAQAIVAAMDGLQVQFLLEPDKYPMVASLEMTIACITEHLQARAAEA